MKPTEPKIIRCAVYTRKSDRVWSRAGVQLAGRPARSLRGLYQEPGPRGLAARSPTTMTMAVSRAARWSGRPCRRLLADIRAGKIDIVVVYKVDRLTRSLADFAKLVELFDAHACRSSRSPRRSTPPSSMGRLTLNVLLSFAQFEREVTGERIRDKIAASKRKGMWMGGRVPLGYRVADRKLSWSEGSCDGTHVLSPLSRAWLHWRPDRGPRPPWSPHEDKSAYRRQGPGRHPFWDRCTCSSAQESLLHRRVPASWTVQHVLPLAI